MTAPIRAVLCAVDLSPLSSDVMNIAAHVAEAAEARLTLVHAIEALDSRYDFVVDEVSKKIEHEARQKVHAEVQRLGKTSEVPVEVIIAKGAALQTILSAVKARRPDLLVIGTHGGRVIDQLWMGSVAQKILHLSPVAVLVVPQRPPERAGLPLQKIVCGVDFSDCSRLALERAIDLAACEKISAMTVLNCFEIPMGYLEAGMTYAMAFEKIRAVHQKEMDEFLRPYAGSPVTLLPVIEEGPSAATLAAYAEKAGAGLLVVGTHGRSRLKALVIGSVSFKLMNHSKVPVLAVKSSEHAQALWSELEKI